MVNNNSLANLTPGSSPGKIKLNAMSYALILRTLFDDPCTLEDLSEVSGVSIGVIRSYIKELRKQKLVRLCDKLPNINGSKVTPLYEWAPNKKDVVIKPKSHAERSRDYKQRKLIKALTNGLTNSIATN